MQKTRISAFLLTKNNPIKYFDKTFCTILQGEGEGGRRR